MKRRIPPAGVTESVCLGSRAAELRADGLSAKDAVRVLMEDAGAPRNLAYRLAHDRD